LQRKKSDEKESLSIHSEVIVLLALISILVGIIIAIPIVYSKGKSQSKIFSNLFQFLNLDQVVETRTFNVSSSKINCLNSICK